ncbi:hypothetical protein BJY04DRAFT_14374 [Aspergillus karnatakaensis]|uniref:bifunctional triacylglycerol lipase/ester hydrolase n=1 Tax=Aspergillus karnatakaensis TaxID=1810916 RepID=UPI003CCD231B
MPLPKPHIETDSFFHETPSSSSSSISYPTTIYFITGNPGLISYYHTFLSLLAAKLSSTKLPGLSPDLCPVHILGHSLAGFELEKENDEPEKKNVHYYNVEEQILHVQKRIQKHILTLREHIAAKNTTEKPKVILIGHSVGSYIAMEVLRRHREAHAHAHVNATSAPESDSDSNFDITAGILLFPTVMDIAMSPSGRKLTFLLSMMPNLALVVSFLAKVLTSLLSAFILRAVISLVMKNPPTEARDATVRFLESRRGVRQALYMATDEMRVISSDKWSDDVWGVSAASVKDSRGQPLPPAQLYFYFGRNDHWVAERTREEIVAARGGSKAGAGPRMVVCEESVPHAFCLRHNEVMARKVADMLGEILN